MSFRVFATVICLASFSAFGTDAFAQRGAGEGSRGGAGGASRGPGGAGAGARAGGPSFGGGRPGGGQAPGGGAHSAGGFGGGLNMSEGPGRESAQANPGLGPHGRPGMGGQYPGARPGTTTPRPGVGEGVTPNVRPGVGVAGTPATGVGVRPGVRPGNTELPSNAFARPINASGAYGTRYTSNSALAVHQNNFYAAGTRYPSYTPASFAGAATAWAPTNLTNASLYTHPGYQNLSVGLGLTPQPIAYDYGANIVTQSNAVYINGDPSGTPQQYSNQASQIAAAGQGKVADDSKWLPLGIFALVEGDANTSDDVFQLAVNPQGVMRGNYQNRASGETIAISGFVDKKTQRAAWTIGDDKLPVYEAGIANLTKDATPILIHLEDGQIKQMTLIRLQQPNP